ncbi:MAG: acetyl-CoA hydrolase/transferase C-terminal domain-containing protein [Ilumatobacteraceae bacterium]
MNAPESVIDLVRPGTNLVVPLANGEPVSVMDAIEAHAEQLHGVRVHQMHAVKDRPTMHGAFGSHLHHVSYFLSPVTRPHFANGTIDFVPSNFSEVPILMRRLPNPLVLVSASPMDRHGFFSLGTNCDYVASLIGRAPIFVEANRQMPRTFGRTQVHVSQVAGWCEADYPLHAAAGVEPDEIDCAIGRLVAERVPNGATIQTGIGAIPNALLASLGDHRDLGVHTELFSDGLMNLVEQGVVNGVRKQLNRTKAVATFAHGTQELYDFLHENPAVELWPVRYVNDPRVIGQETDFVSINATIEVDLMGQCASESIGSKLFSGSGGQADFARGAMYSKGGQGFIVTRSTTHGGMSRIVAQLHEGAVVTTMKNTVDKVVTEYGVAELRGQTVRDRAKRLIAIAHPSHRDDLERSAKELGFI